MSTKLALGQLKQLLKAKNLAIAEHKPTIEKPLLSPAENKRFVDYFPKIKPKHGLTDLDKHQFAQAVKDVRKLKSAKRAVITLAPPMPIPRLRELDELAALAQSQAAVNPSPMAWDLGMEIEEDQSYLRSGANPDLLRKLRRGLLVVQSELDLHHHTQDEAHEAMSVFLAVAKASKQRCVRIIHGKGHGSLNKEPILKSKVRRWLQLRSDVLAFCEPKPNAGGGGAVLVLLGV